MLTVEAASRQIQKKVFLCFQYEIVNFILFFCPPHQTIFPITYRRQRILDFSNWFQSHYMSFFLFFLFEILIVELFFFFKTEHLFTNYKGGRIDYLVFLLFTRRKFVTSVRCRMKTPIWLFFSYFPHSFFTSQRRERKSSKLLFQNILFSFSIEGVLVQINKRMSGKTEMQGSYIWFWHFGQL